MTRSFLLLSFSLLSVFSCRGPRLYYQFPVSYNNHLIQQTDTTNLQESIQLLTVSTDTKSSHFVKPLPGIEQAPVSTLPKISKERKREYRQSKTATKKKDEGAKPEKKKKGLFWAGIGAALLGNILVQIGFFHAGIVLLLASLMMLAIHISEAAKRRRAASYPEEIQKPEESDSEEVDDNTDLNSESQEDLALKHYRSDALTGMWFGILAMLATFTVILPIVALILNISYNIKYKNFKKNLKEESKARNRLNVGLILSIISMFFTVFMVVMIIVVINSGLFIFFWN